jgi:dTDP-4-amino-4,6-dideoxy-D-galactose acyltransferase
MIDIATLCQYLDWDSNFFGKRIATVRVNHLSQDQMAAVIAWCKAERIDCLYFSIEAHDSETVRLAEDHQFRFVDIRLTLDCRLERETNNFLPTSNIIFRQSVSADIPALKAIARTVHTDTRFFHDPQFPRVLCEALYETWIEKSCTGYADSVLVPVLNEQAVGYISCHLPSANSDAKIGLVGIAPDAQGLGLGGELIGRALAYFRENGVSYATVVTQGRNARAQRLYQRFGFLTKSVYLWYHKWFL